MEGASAMADPEAAKAAADAASDTGFWAAATAGFGALTAYLGRKTGRASREAEVAERITKIAAETSGNSTMAIVGAINGMRKSLDAAMDRMHERLDRIDQEVSAARRESAEREARIARAEGRR